VAITADPKREGGVVAMQRIIGLVDFRLKENGFEISTTKTNTLHCCRKHVCGIPNFVEGDKTVVTCDNAKFLGSGRRALLKVGTSLRCYNKTFRSRFQRLLDSLDVHRSQLIRQNRIKQIPPWAFQQLNLDISLTRMKKCDTCNEIFHQEALSAVEKYDSVVYKDGSKMSKAVGFPIVNEHQTAEAIFDACLILKNNSHKRVAIATDSLSTLMGVINPENRDRLIS
jgi:hypothetical protein